MYFFCVNVQKKEKKKGIKKYIIQRTSETN